MQRFRVSALAVLLTALLLLIAGCGGGGSGFSGGGPGGGPGSGVNPSNEVSMFATDSPGAYAHVWVTILGVSLTGSSGTVSAYSSTTGEQIDVAALGGSNSAQEFSFLATAAIPAGTYTSATLTLAPTVTLVENGSTTSTTATFSGLNGSGDKSVNISFGHGTVVSSGSSLVFDFDLAQWNLVDNQLTCVVSLGTGTNLSTANQIPTTSVGTVSSLSGTAPTQSFTLSRDDHSRFTVTTSSSTALSNSDGSANPTLSNGETVVVEGTYSVASHSLTATSIQIQVGSDTAVDTRAMASGTLASYTSGSSSFTLTITRARRFTPTGTTLTVAMSGDARLFGFRGENLTATQFFALLPSATEISASGIYTASNNTLTANDIELSGPWADDTNGVTVRGTAGTGSTGASISLTLTEEDGLDLATGSTITVVPGANVTYLDTNGYVVTQSTFTSDLASAASVSAEGNYVSATNTLTANTIRLWSSATGYPQIRLVGTTSAFSSNGSFDLMLSSWGLNPFTMGISVEVDVSSSTTYSIAGAASTQAAFDAAETNQSIVVIGSLNSDGTLSATSVRTGNQ